MITTGGTIASQEGEDGLEPKTTGQQMLDLIPELQGLCEIDCVDLLNLDSTNMQPEEWAVMAKAAFEGWNCDYSWNRYLCLQCSGTGYDVDPS